MGLGGVTELVGKVVKLDMNTDSRSPGRFARMVVYVNLDKPLVPQVLINGRTQKVEYESLSTICFNCGRYGHVDNMCPFRNVESSTEKGNKSPEVSSENSKSAREESEKKDESYGPWMIVERKLRRRARDNGQKTARFYGKDKEGSCITGHNNSNFMKENNEGDISAVRNSKGKEIINENNQGHKSEANPNGQSNLMAAKAKSNKSLRVGSSMNPGLSNKNNTGLVLRLSPVQNTYLQISKEPNTDLDLSVSTAREQLEQIRREGIAQTYLAVTEIDGRPIAVEAAFSTSIDSNSHKDLGETSIPLPPIRNLKGNEPKVVTVAVGNLDSDKHSVVTFLENKSETHRRSASHTNFLSILP